MGQRLTNQRVREQVIFGFIHKSNLNSGDKGNNVLSRKSFLIPPSYVPLFPLVI